MQMRAPRGLAFLLRAEIPQVTDTGNRCGRAPARVTPRGHAKCARWCLRAAHLLVAVISATKGAVIAQVPSWPSGVSPSVT
jgi:hypothetical protein